MQEGKEITTIEGLAKESEFHLVQQAFIVHNAFQCGYCTPGWICSVVSLISEAHANTEEDIHDLMSGDIYLCGVYFNIL